MNFIKYLFGMKKSEEVIGKATIYRVYFINKRGNKIVSERSYIEDEKKDVIDRARKESIYVDDDKIVIAITKEGETNILE